MLTYTAAAASLPPTVTNNVSWLELRLRRKPRPALGLHHLAN